MFLLTEGGIDISGWLSQSPNLNLIEGLLEFNIRVMARRTSDVKDM